MNKKKLLPLAALVLSVIFFYGCKKAGDDESGAYTLMYADSILYQRPQSGDYVAEPRERRAGTYTGFPEGIEIDEKTGAINVSKSETGLRYRVTHTSPKGVETSTLVVISGITFPDRFYRLTTDSLALPVYNARAGSPLPLAGSLFDEGNLANSGGCAVRTDNGVINLAKSVRDGVFGNNPDNDDRRDIEIKYRLNDQSGKSLNKLKVRLYYYDNMSSVAPDLLETLNEREQDGVFIGGRGEFPVGNFTSRLAKPRPPCVIIIAH